MKLVCPICGAHGSAELFASDAEARAACELLARMPADIGPTLLAYLGLFRPGKRALAWARVRSLVAELEPLIAAGHVMRGGRAWPAGPRDWRQALQQVVDARATLRLPLKGHGYLLEVLAGGARTADAQAERQRHEDALERGRKPADRPEAVPVGMTDLVRRSVVDAENRVRKRLGEPPLTQAEADELLARDA